MEGKYGWIYVCHVIVDWRVLWGLKYIFFYDHVTVHRNRFRVNKSNRCTEFQFYWYYDSTYFGQPFCPSSGVLSRTSALVHFMRLWWPFATKSRMERMSGWNCSSTWLCLEPVIRNLHETYQCRMYSRKLLMMGREDARNM